jgi:putative transcriptional regulator
MLALSCTGKVGCWRENDGVRSEPLQLLGKLLWAITIALRQGLVRIYEAQPDLAVKNQIRVPRAVKDWSQAELAEAVRVSRNSINAIENCKFDPSLPLAFRIADAFGLSVDQVFDKTGV